jgi:acyl-CoA thioesterase
LLAVAAEIHRGGRNGLYDVRVSGPDGQAVAVFRGRSATTRELMLDGGPTPDQ